MVKKSVPHNPQTPRKTAPGKPRSKPVSLGSFTEGKGERFRAQIEISGEVYLALGKLALKRKVDMGTAFRDIIEAACSCFVPSTSLATKTDRILIETGCDGVVLDLNMLTLEASAKLRQIAAMHYDGNIGSAIDGAIISMLEWDHKTSQRAAASFSSNDFESAIQRTSALLGLLLTKLTDDVSELMHPGDFDPKVSRNICGLSQLIHAAQRDLDSCFYFVFPKSKGARNEPDPEKNNVGSA